VGLAKVPGVISLNTVGNLRELVLEQLDRCGSCSEKATRNPLGWLMDDRFSADVLQPRAGIGVQQTRWDLKLELTNTVGRALVELLADRSGPLGASFETLAGGLGAELFELAAFVTAPGAPPQEVHMDTATSQPSLFTVFVALQDIASDMGPTQFLPGTTTRDAHQRFDMNPGPLVQEVGCVAATLSAGDAVLYDGRVLHCSSANRSDKLRVVFYVTFRHPAAEVDGIAMGRSIRRHYAGRFRLGDFRRGGAADRGARAR